MFFQQIFKMSSKIISAQFCCFLCITHHLPNFLLARVDRKVFSSAIVDDTSNGVCHSLRPKGKSRDDKSGHPVQGAMVTCPA